MSLNDLAVIAYIVGAFIAGCLIGEIQACDRGGCIFHGNRAAQQTREGSEQGE